MARLLFLFVELLEGDRTDCFVVFFSGNSPYPSTAEACPFPMGALWNELGLEVKLH